MTDSVNCVAFFDPVSLDMPLFFLRRRRTFFLRRGGRPFRGRLRRGAAHGRRRIAPVCIGAARLGAVQPAIVFCGAENLLHVVLRLGERDVVDEFLTVDARSLGNPSRHAVLAGVVAGKRIVSAAELPDEIGEVGGAHPQVRLRRRQ